MSPRGCGQRPHRFPAGRKDSALGLGDPERGRRRQSLAEGGRKRTDQGGSRQIKKPTEKAKIGKGIDTHFLGKSNKMDRLEEKTGNLERQRPASWGCRLQGRKCPEKLRGHSPVWSGAQRGSVSGFDPGHGTQAPVAQPGAW